MALKKEVIFNNIPTNYHRIINLNSCINEAITIEVASYTNEYRRDSEIELKELKEKDIEDLTNEEKDIVYNNETPFVYYSRYKIDYEENMTIKEAYEYLKNTPEFEGSEDA